MTADGGKRRTIGLHGLDIIRVLFLLGCATVRDLSGILGLPESTIGKQLHLLAQGAYVRRIKVLPSWEEGSGGGIPYVYMLTRQGVDIGGGEVGIEDPKLARAAYASCRPESLLSHRLMQIRYLRFLIEAAKGSIFRVEYFAAEHAEGFPLELWQGSNYPVSRIVPVGDLSRTIRPDGLIILGAGDANRNDPPLDIILELETGSRNLKDVLAKVLFYLSYFELRCSTGEPLSLPDDPGGFRYLHHPVEAWPAVLFLTPKEAAARRMRRYIVRGLAEHDGYQAWVWRMVEQHGIDPAWLFLFGSLETSASYPSAPLEAIYSPLEPHADSGGGRDDPDRVSLVDALAISDGWGPIRDVG